MRLSNPATIQAKPTLLLVGSLLPIFALPACEYGGYPAAPTPSPLTPTPSILQPTSTVTAEGATPSPSRTSSGHPFAPVIGTTGAPPGWSVELCENEGDARLLYLCVSKGNEAIGRIELSSYPLDTLPEFQQQLTDAGLAPGAIDYANPDHARRVQSALMAFVENYHKTFEEDRKGVYGDEVVYTRLATKEARMGEMMGVSYGFAGIARDGTVRERWLSHAAFDGDLLYIVVAHYDPSSHFSFATNEDLSIFEPYLPPFVEGLRVPNALLNSDQELR